MPRSVPAHWRAHQRVAAKEDRGQRPYDPLYIGLVRDREELYSRVNQRVDQMLKEGLVAEVAALLERYPDQPTALQALGYKEIAHYLRGAVPLTEAVELLKRDTRRYAKRQLSWFKRNKRIHWFNLTTMDESAVEKGILELWQDFSSVQR